MTYGNYSYNAWGEPVRVYLDNGSEITAADNIANLNPIRYRGYYYDTDTGFYYLAGSEKMKILSKIISFAAFLLSIILIFIILTSYSQLDEDYILKIIIVYFGLFFIRLFLIPRLAERIGKKKRQAVELQEQREQQIKNIQKLT